MANSPENMIPWDLINSSLQKQITAEEDLQLQLWISASEENRELFALLKQIWTEKLDDYKAYLEADENTAWDSFRLKLQPQPSSEKETNVIPVDFSKPRFSIIRWASVAAVLIVAAGSIIWYVNSNDSGIYQTGVGEQKTISLSDGSSIRLLSNTRIEVSKEFNKSNREMDLKTGEAFFEVKHDEQIPFIVNLGTASVKDIGTSFFIGKQKDSIKLSVTSGKVAFINNSDNESRELSAGMSLKMETSNFVPVITVDSITTKQNLLHFENTVLPEVVLNLEKVYSKKILLTDSVLMQKRFTADLNGQSFERAINILSQSLNIKYSFENGVYYLKNER